MSQRTRPPRIRQCQMNGCYDAALTGQIFCNRHVLSPEGVRFHKEVQAVATFLNAHEEAPTIDDLERREARERFRRRVERVEVGGEVAPVAVGVNQIKQPGGHLRGCSPRSRVRRRPGLGQMKAFEKGLPVGVDGLGILLPTLVLVVDDVQVPPGGERRSTHCKKPERESCSVVSVTIAPD